MSSERSPDLHAYFPRRSLLLALATGVAGVLAGNPFGGGRNGSATGTAAVARTSGGIPPPRPGVPTVVETLPGPTQRIALTIDDGYDAATVAAYVRFCVDTGIHLTFNPNGVYRHVWERHVAELRSLIAAGQVQIGNHTFSHRNLVEAPDAVVRAEIDNNESWIEETFGVTARPWLRPPFGAHDERTDEIAASLGFTEVLMWDGDLRDSVLLSPPELLRQADRYLRPGRLVLGHANHRAITHIYGDLTRLISERKLVPSTLDEIFGTSRTTG